MKYVIVIPDGSADEPQDELGGRTPLEAAQTPAMDALVAAGVVGRACHTPENLPAGSEVGNMSLLGYDPLVNFTGRAPIEAAAQGIQLGLQDWAIRCNLVTIQDQTMKDFTADHISTAEATALLRTAQEELGNRMISGGRLEFVPGVSYRNLLLWRSDGREGPFSMDLRATPPHDLTDKSVLDDFPRGPGSEILRELMDASARLLVEHPVNQKRIAEGNLPATHLWLWGVGQAPNLQPFAKVYGPQGAMITAVDLLRGLASLVGWQQIEVAGATGYTDTDYAAKGREAINALENVDLICVHVEAPDEASHEGDCAAKVKAIEQIDQHVVEPLWKALQTYDAWRIMISPDHPTFLNTKTHTHGDVPIAMAGTHIKPDKFTTYGDTNAAKSSLAFEQGWRAMRWFIEY